MKRRKFIKNTGKSVGGIVSLPLITGFNISKNLNSSVNIGIIGTGSRGGGLIPFINEIENLNVVACCDILPFRLNDALKKAPEKTIAYENYKDLLNNNDIDAVLIATPFSTHHIIANDAIDSGKHIYCEKTLCRGVANNLNLVKKVKNSNIIFQTGHQYHSSKLYKHVVNKIKQGDIGEIAAISCQWNRNGDWRRKVPDPKWERLINWRLYKEFSGGLVAELCSHQMDFTNWILESPPIRVMGTGGIDFWKDGRETYDNVHIIYEYPSGVKAIFTSLTTNALGDYQIKVLGNKGAITLDYFKAWFYPENNEPSEKGTVDGVSGASLEWDLGKGYPIDMEHIDPTLQAIIDFRESVINNSKPISNVLTGGQASIMVQVALDAIESKSTINWEKSYNL